MRIFVSPLATGEVVDAVELVDGEGRRAAAVIARIGEDATVLHATAIEAIAPAAPRVRVLLPPIKGDRMDACIEKLVEVGSDELVIWPAARSVVRLDGERRATRVAHYQAIAQAAARQSGRAAIPPVHYAESLAAALSALPAGARVVLDPSADRAPFPLADDLTLISGPEGGLAPSELDALSSFTPLGLGPRVLRADTAPLIAVALVRAATSS
jgi:16S rRNA (uracil1498-N3)-methyltransferase